MDRRFTAVDRQFGEVRKEIQETRAMVHLSYVEVDRRLRDLEPVPHRHVVLTMPRLLRGVFRRRRELLLDLAQCAAEAVTEYMKRHLGAEARPGIVVSIASAGDLLQWHPHGHLLVTESAVNRSARMR